MRILYFVLLFAFNYTLAQKDTIKERKYNVFINSILKNTNRYSSDKILHIGDSLYNNAINDEQRVKALFVCANAYMMQQNRNKSLEIALRADSIAEKAELNFVSRTSGLVASQYIYLKLYDQGINYLKKSLHTAHLLTKKDELNTVMMVSIELGRIQYEKGEYLNSIKTLRKNIEIIEQAKKENLNASFSISLLPSLVNIGNSYYKLSIMDSAKIYYIKAAKESERNPPAIPLSIATIYARLADIEIKQGDLNKALMYLDQAKKMSSGIKDKDLDFEINKVLDSYYISKNNYKKSDSIKNEVAQFYENKEINNSRAVQSVVKKERQNLKKSTRVVFYLKILIIVIIFILGLTFLYFQQKNKIINSHFKKIIEEYKNKAAYPNNAPSKNDLLLLTTNSVHKEFGKKIFSLEKEKELLQKLEYFEMGNEFTSKNFTISNLAIMFDTNTKYVSQLILLHRGKSFNDYLNTIRMQYIMDKLINNPEYLNYKIQYLAEASGYSSHSRFTQIFKREFNLSPSEFILKLSKKKM